MHSLGPEWTYSLILVARATTRVDHSPRENLFLLLASHTRTLFYQTFGPLSAALDLFRSRGPIVCYGRTSVPRTRTVFIYYDPSGPFCPLALRKRTILSVSGPFSIACVARVDSILSNVRTSARHARTFHMLWPDLCLARGPFSFIRTPSGRLSSLALHSTILSMSGPFSIACVARADSILSNVRTSARRVGPF